MHRGCDDIATPGNASRDDRLHTELRRRLTALLIP